MNLSRLFALALCMGLLFLGTGFSAQAQKASVSGVVSDELGPLYGVTVWVKGTTNGATTDFNGVYKISDIAPGDQVIMFSFVGMKTVEQPVTLSAGQGLKLDITMQEDRVLLDDVVVIGYGTIQEKHTTGSVAKVDAKQIEEGVIQDFSGAIQGRAAGVTVTQGGGMAGTASSVRIRGNNSISAGGQPLYVVDGIIINSDGIGSPGYGSTTNPLSDINPDDIESMTILKDADASAIYGARGANGVIIITTKRGKTGRSKISASYSNGVGGFAKREEYLTAQESLALRDTLAALGLMVKDNAKTELRDDVYRAEADSFVAVGGNTNWPDAVTQLTRMEVAAVSVSGGSEKTQFYVSANYRDEHGFIITNRFQRASARLNLDHQATNKLKLGVSVNLLNTVNDRVNSAGNGGFGWATKLHNYLPVYDNNQEDYAMTWAPQWQLLSRELKVKSYRTISNVYAEYEFVPGLKLRSTFGADLLNQIELFHEPFNPDASYHPEYNSTSLSDKRTNVISYTQNNYLEFNDTLFNDNHIITLTGGNEIYESNTSGIGMTGKDFTNESLRSPALGNEDYFSYWSWGRKYGFISYFSRAQYRLKDRYIVKASIRSDGSSKFGKENRWGYFPAAGAAWVISDEPFMDSVHVISNLKIRANHGLTGNSNIPDNRSVGFYTNVAQGYLGEPGIVPSNLPNGDLRWEKGVQTDINVEIGLWENRLTASASAYYKRSKDLLLRLALPLSSGYESAYQNLGELENKGVEIEIHSVNVENLEKKFSWSTDFNIAFNRNKVLDAGGLSPDAFELGKSGEARVVVGEPVGVSYVVQYAGVAQEDGEVIIVDANNVPIEGANGKYEAGQDMYYDLYGNRIPWHSDILQHKQATGTPNPKFSGGINNTLVFKEFEFSLLWSYSYGNSVYIDEAKYRIGGDIQGVNQWRDILNYWTPENTDTEVPALEYAILAGSAGGYRNSSRFLYDASFLRLRAAAFTWTVPTAWAEKMHLYGAKVYLRGSNLLTFTKDYPGWDPEVLRADVDPNSEEGNVAFATTDYSTPQPRTVVVGVKIDL